MLGMGFVTDWTQLLACRFLLGLLESGELLRVPVVRSLSLTTFLRLCHAFAFGSPGFFP